jgi:alpha-D-xyloside xylohydrolase
MPYLYATAVQAHRQGTPSMRAMMLEFPDDPGCDYLDRQYMLGDALLVAPVFTYDGTVDYYLPAGRWTAMVAGRGLDGGRWVREQHGFLSLPLLARPNSIVAMGAHAERPDYDLAQGVTFHLFELGDGATATAQVPTPQGAAALSITAGRAAETITIDVAGDGNEWSVLLRGIPAVGSVEGGAAQSEALGTRIVPAGGARRLVIRL